VLEAMRAVTREQAAVYPDYGEAIAAAAAYFGLPPEQFVLTNGLDEGIHATCQAWLLRGDDGRQLDAVVVEPAFDMYAACADAAGGRVVTVAPRPEFEFPLEETVAVLRPQARVLFLTSPNNPTGISVRAAAVEALSRALPPGAVLFLDEAYIDFGGESFLPRLARCPNVLVGRTFAKAHGLAAVRLGAVLGVPETVARLRRVLPPYSLNVFARAGLIAATGDREYLSWYTAQVAESKARVYAVCRRLDVHFWPSDANFVLIRIGDRAKAVAAALAARGVFVRDRTREPGCDGCLRVTTGVVEHTERFVAAFEEVLCAGA
jgi:histidinol-phosphate aminotransferase